MSDHDQFVRLSDSPLWALQRAYFETQGPRAWASGTVPHYVTCNPYMGRAFAEVIAGFAADVARTSADAERTLYIVELGAGSGRLAWHIVRALQGALDVAALGWRTVYVMSDLAEATVQWWQSHPWLAPLIEAGVLDVARFDAAGDDELVLRHSGRVLSPGDPADAVVVVANYLFDSLPQDVYVSRGGVLHECLAAATGVRAAPGGGGFQDVELAWRTRPAQPAPDADPVHARVLDAYRGTDGVFTFPCVALDVLDRLRTFSTGPLLVLSADKGTVRLEDAIGAAPPAIVKHGSVSMGVNYHALGMWALAHDGAWFHTEHAAGTLAVCGLVVDLDDRRATLASFERAIGQRGPDDFYALKRVLVARAADLSLGELLAYVRLSGHDAKVFLDCAAAIRDALTGPDVDDADRRALALAIARVWDGYLPIGEERDLAACLADLSGLLGRATDAARFWAASRLLHGHTAATPRPARPRRRAEDPFDVITGAG